MLAGNPINILGFEIPSNSTLFLTILSIHILAGITCVAAGAFAMLSKKQSGIHPKSGTIYFISIWVVFITASLIAIFRWREDYYLFILGTIAFCAAFIGRMARKNKWTKWSITHIVGMGTSYIFLLTAFYVDNGRFLPLWKSLPHLVYWLLPSFIGFPIIIRTLLKNPFSKKYFKRNILS